MKAGGKATHFDQFANFNLPTREHKASPLKISKSYSKRTFQSSNMVPAQQSIKSPYVPEFFTKLQVHSHQTSISEEGGAVVTSQGSGNPSQNHKRSKSQSKFPL